MSIDVDNPMNMEEIRGGIFFCQLELISHPKQGGLFPTELKSMIKVLPGWQKSALCYVLKWQTAADLVSPPHHTRALILLTRAPASQANHLAEEAVLNTSSRVRWILQSL